MTDQAVEEAAHAYARAVVAGDIGTTVRGMTPDALAKAMLLGNTTWTYTGYELAVYGHEGEDYVFDITFRTDLGPMPLRYRFRHLDGVWKVADVEKSDEPA